jgi:class 3 adenylate cyclase
VQVCASCSQENPDTARFCNACGSPLAAVAPLPEERKIVTVLFVDLVGFTSRSERLDPEDVRAIQAPYFARVRETIESFGGTVEKYIGDAVMAVFGAPVAHGDDPERAVRAALAIVEGAGDLDLRIAVNTGEALVSLGANPSQGEGIVSGDVVNTAARLQSAAPVNGVLVGEETYLATRGVIFYEGAEPVVAKGKELPIDVWRAVGVTADPGERPAGRVPMVGRSTELEALCGIWGRVTAERRPQLVTLFGPAGIGKSRLTAEFSDLVADKGARVIRGRSLPYGEMTPYGSFAAQVKQVAGMFDTDPIDVAQEKLTRAATALLDGAGAEISAHLARLIGVSREAGVDDRQTLFFAARRFIEALAEQQPTVLVFEDIHVAASSMLDLLEMLGSRVRDVPLLLLTQARPELLAARPAWGGGLPAYSALPLEPLRSEEARELASRLLDAAGAPVESAGEVVDTAEGNPLFLEELASSVAEGRADPGELPTSIRGIVAARIDALPRDEREALLDGAAFGKVFWSQALPSITPAALDALEGRDLIRRDPVSRLGTGYPQYAFKHQLIREVAYATLPRARRRQRHESIAVFLEEVVGEVGDVAPALAHHWNEAGDSARAVRYYMAAGDHANRGWAKDEAAGYYRQAFGLVPEEERELRRELTKRIAIAGAAAVHAEDMLAGKGPSRQVPESR